MGGWLSCLEFRSSVGKGHLVSGFHRGHFALKPLVQTVIYCRTQWSQYEKWDMS